MDFGTISKALALVFVLLSSSALLAADRTDTVSGDEGLPAYWRRVLSCNGNELKIQVDLVNRRGMRVVVGGERNIHELRRAGRIGQISGNTLVLDQVTALKGNVEAQEVVCASDFDALRRKFIRVTYDSRNQTARVTSEDAITLPNGGPLATYTVEFKNCVAHGDEDFAGDRVGGAKDQFELIEDALVFAKVGAVLDRGNCGVAR